MGKIIGILGGIGPESSAEFYKDLIIHFQKKGVIKANQDYPKIIINSIPAPELFIGKLELKMYKDGLKDLERWGADFIVMVCNTAYVHFDEFQKSVNVPIINLRDEVKEYLKNRNIKTITVFGTKVTLENELYGFKEFFYNPLNQSEIEIVEEAINNFIKGKDKVKSIKSVEKIIQKYSKHSKAIIAGCTELGLMLKNTKFNVINPMDVLVIATYNKWMKD